MRTHSPRFSRLSASCAATALTFWAANSSIAAQLQIADSPVFLTQGVEPNLIMAIDDSGSMDFEVLLRGNDGSAWWRSASASGSCTSATGRSFVGCVSNSDGTSNVESAGVLNFNNAGESNSTWRKYSYLFPNGSSSNDTTFRRRLGDGTNDHFAIPPIPAYAWSRSPTYNAAYFNPANTYKKWPDGGGYTFSDSNPTAARFDPVFGSSTDAIDLTQDIAGTNNVSPTSLCSALTNEVADNYYFRVQRGMTIPAGACIRTGGVGDSWRAVGSGGCSIDEENACAMADGTTGTIGGNTGLAIRYFPATFYLPADVSLPTGFGFIGTTVSGQAPDGTTLNGYEIKPGNFATTQQYQAAIQNFANWFTYYRKRHQALRAGLGSAFEGISGMRVNGFTINNRVDVTMNTIDDDNHRQALYQNFYKDFVRSGGTPNRRAVYSIVQNYKRTGNNAPIQYACQKNFGMLFTDGFSNTPESGDGFSGIGNIDGTAGAPFQDDVSDTIADGVMDAYANNIRDDLDEGLVRIPAACAATNRDPRLDCNPNPHMNFYAVTLGTRGLQFNPDANPPQDPYVTTPTWPTTFPARHPNAVDDLWHATINGRGKLLNAKNPTEISEKLTEVLRAVSSESASASSASVNSGSISADSRVFQAKFNSGNWTGELLAFQVNPVDGSLSAASNWNVEGGIPSHTTRKVFTLGSDGQGIRFHWDDLKDDDTRVAQLGANATEAENVVNYIRGSDALEGTTLTSYRKREAKLGDIINSSPLYVGRPAFFYQATFPDAGYSQFRLNNQGRTGVVYVGANDGMLHAFNATTGAELFAYVPGAVTENLKALTSRAYDQAHKYFVDGSPNMGDVYVNNAWRTVLIGGLNKGGRAIYALDVTDPTSFAASKVMWEYTHPDLGYTFSQPAIVRLQSGHWAAVFGNGYNSAENGGSGSAMLFVVDIATGQLLKTIDTKAGSSDVANGLGTATVVDVNSDSIADYAYAGDLLGNLWKFDLRGSSSEDWQVAYGSATAPEPLYIAEDADGARQPITSRVDVARAKNGAGLLVLFGTGKFLEVSDRGTTDVQTFYGIIDTNTGSDAFSGRDDLAEQEILAEVQVSDSEDSNIKYWVRVTSNNPVETRGWFMDLVPPSGPEGERVVSNPVYRDGRVIFTTVIPSTDPCSSGGDSWIMEFDAHTGARLASSPFDINRDGKIDDSDIAAWKDSSNEDQTDYVSGVKSEVGIVTEPGILADPNNPVEYKYMAGSKGLIQTVRESADPRSRGRQSWRAIK